MPRLLEVLYLCLDQEERGSPCYQEIARTLDSVIVHAGGFAALSEIEGCQTVLERYGAALLASAVPHAGVFAPPLTGPASSLSRSIAPPTANAGLQK